MIETIERNRFTLTSLSVDLRLCDEIQKPSSPRIALPWQLGWRELARFFALLGPQLGLNPSLETVSIQDFTVSLFLNASERL